MSVQWVFNNCEEHLKRVLISAWDWKQPRLVRLLKTFKPDQARLRISVHHKPRPSTFEVRAVLQLPVGTLVAEEIDQSPAAALNPVIDALVRELKHHKERLRREYVYQRKHRRREDLIAAGPLLERDAFLGRRQAFLDLLRPLLEPLRDHVYREFRVLALEGSLDPREVRLDDLIHEVTALAWDRFTDRPQDHDLDLWLIELLHDVVARRCTDPTVASLDSGRSEVGHLNGGWWEDEFLRDCEPLALEQFVLDKQESWEVLSGEEQKARLRELIGRLPDSHRQAVLLRVMEGFDFSEIAMVQNRSAAEVAADFEAAVRALRAGARETGTAEAIAHAS